MIPEIKGLPYMERLPASVKLVDIRRKKNSYRFNRSLQNNTWSYYCEIRKFFLKIIPEHEAISTS